jgi:hypothetical protein
VYYILEGYSLILFNHIWVAEIDQVELLDLKIKLYGESLGCAMAATMAVIMACN